MVERIVYNSCNFHYCSNCNIFWKVQKHIYHKKTDRCFNNNIFLNFELLNNSTNFYLLLVETTYKCSLTLLYRILMLVYLMILKLLNLLNNFHSLYAFIGSYFLLNTGIYTYKNMELRILPCKMNFICSYWQLIVAGWKESQHT